MFARLTMSVKFKWSAVLFALLVLAPLSRASNSGHKVGELKITILSTMLVSTHDGTGEWGFSALVEADGHKILVDTGGAPDTVLKNTRELNIDLSDVRDVLLTHNHGDHTSGLMTLRREMMKRNPEALSRVYVARGIFWSRPKNGHEGNNMVAVKTEYEKTGGKFIELNEGEEIFPGAWLTGPITRKYPEKNWSDLGKVMTPTGLAEDTIPEDMSLVLDTVKGLVVVTGCGHAGVVNILTQSTEHFPGEPVYGLVGGIHLYRQSDTQLDWTSDKLKGFDVENLLGAHCTGIEAVYHLRQRMGLSRKTAVVGSVGAAFTLKDGIVPGELEK
jgi:7,8-dihydropterin-6-yl-methyl-4-(beta-D-ribofuranosyl)aminobenzene 5'-phosphate synthase